MQAKKILLHALITGGLFFSCALTSAAAEMTLSAFRQEKDPLVRRKIFRTLTDRKPVPGNVLLAGVKDADEVIKRYSLYLLVREKHPDACKILLGMAGTRDPVTLELVYQCTLRMSGREQRSLLEKIAGNPMAVRAVYQARRRVRFEFYRENKRLKESNAYDHDVQVVRKVTLPVKDWAFMADPEKDGHQRGYFFPSIQVNDWRKITLGSPSAEKYTSVRGISWYRVSFAMISRMDHAAAELFFPAVKGSVWVWLNGKYIGQAEAAARNGAKTVHLDVTNELLWGQTNVLTVRLEDPSGKGNIASPVCVEILK